MSPLTLEQVERICAAIVDPYIIVDEDRNIVSFNRAFRSLFPRSVARHLAESRCHDVLDLEVCGSRCIALEALERGQGVRYDEIQGKVAETGEELRLIGSATPLTDVEPEGLVLVIYRNVTDVAKIQVKYKHMLDEVQERVQHLERELEDRTAAWLEANDTINRLEQALKTHEKGLWEQPFVGNPKPR